ncbi:hypothetical protein PILCRDRAFT_289755, partial [Piloderma croceum F 1598]
RPVALVTARSVRHFSYENAESIARLKRPTRGGQNLTDRHRRLEKSLRGKEARLKQIDDLPRSSTFAQLSSVPKRPALNTFQGFVIPEQPKPPEPDECCMSGCAICVHDLYLDALTTYHESVSSLRSSLSALDIPESEWPSNIQTSGFESKEERKFDVNMDAFLALERSLREKKAADALSSS